MRRLPEIALPLVVAALALAGGRLPSLDAAPLQAPDKAIAAVGATFEKAFNAHNAPALSALWTENAVHQSLTTGESLKGRNAIAAAYAKLFEQDPKSTLKIAVQSAKVNDDKSATLVGVAQIDHPGAAPTRSLFSAKLAQVGATWLLDQVDEADLPPNAAEGLSPLGWLEGKWSEKLPSGTVVNQYHWVDGGVYMIRNYWREGKEGPVVQGSQIFGWDPEQSCVRTWLFDGSGSFGEGYWQPLDKGKWINKMVVKLPDGRRGSVSQVLTQTDDDSFTLQSIDREIDGQAEPNGAIATMTRVAEPAAAGTKATEGQLP